MNEINLIAPLNNLGYGLVTRNLLLAAHSTERKVNFVPIGTIELEQTTDPFIVDIIKQSHKNGQFATPNVPSVRLYHQFDLLLHAGRPRIGWPIFELDKFSDIELHHLRCQDMLFVASTWASNIIANNDIKVTTKVIPFGVDRNLFNEQRMKQEKSSPTCVFTNIGKWELRKGHDVLLTCFNKAFEPSDNVELVMCCNNPFLQDSGAEWERYYKNSKLGNKIKVINSRFPSQVDLLAIIANTDVGVFPTRAEGWCMPLLEFMSCGKPVIATDYSGHSEFVSNENTKLINFETSESANDGIWFKGQGNWMKFTKNNQDQLIEYMRSLYKCKQESGVLPQNKEGINTATQFSWERTVNNMFGALGG